LLAERKPSGILRAERTFRTPKSLFETRPTPVLAPGTIRGHVACSFLALVLKKELEDRRRRRQRRPRLVARRHC
jgi:hypothetical protein